MNSPKSPSQDNIINNVSRIHVDERISKANNPYYVLCIEFNLPNDKVYTYEALVSREQLPLIEISEPLQDEEFLSSSK